MDRYIIEGIKKYGLRNDVNSNCIIHECYFFDYKGKKYVNIYVKSLDGYKVIQINNKVPISSRIVGDVNVIVLCYLLDDVKDNMIITSVSGKSVENNNLVDPNDFDLDDNNINILKDLELKGFKEICVIPKIKDNYWICSCGNVNTNDFCTNCGTKKQFASLYDTEEKIHKKFALREYERNKFSSENLNEEIILFKNKLKNNKKYNINIDYLDEEFFKNIDEESKFKVESFKNKKSNFKLISKYLILIFIIILILLFVSSTISNNASLEDIKNRISKSCDSTEYSKVNNINSVIDTGNCGTLVYYMINNNLSNNDLILLANSENVELYKSYYSYKKENIHQTLGSNGKIDNDQYLKYLYDNNYETIDEVIHYKLVDALMSFDEEKFTNYLRYLSVGGKEWEYDYEYFESGYDSIDVDNYKYEIGREKNLKNYTKYSLIYHKELERYDCYKADLYSVDNLKFLFTKKDNKVCQHPLSRLINDISVSELDVYINSGGNLDYVSYLGNFIHHLVDEVDADDDINVFVEKLKKLNVNGAINQKMENDDAYPGYTPLDTFIKRRAETCEDANSKYFSSGYLVKNCNAYKAIYSKLKNFGAKCNKECSDEHYLK